MVVLGVEKSLNHRTWVYRQSDEKSIEMLVQKYNMPEILARVLVARHVDFDLIDAFLNPTLKNQLPEPCQLKDMQKAVDRMAQSIMNGEKIGIMGDYDVDGATSSALLKLFLKSLHIKTRVFIPDRDDGYGPNAKEMQKFYDDGIRLVVTVDCGMTAFEPIDFGTKLGLDVIILDHHEPEKSLPNAYAVVNPKRLDESKDNPCHALAAVGVVFLTVVALNRTLREKGFYADKKEPDLRQWLDLVAFGTVCDVVPLRGVNRLFVKSGIKQMAARRNVGLTALSDIAKITEKIGAYHLGYILGPRVNAGGRVGKSDLGMKLLSTFDEVEAIQLASELEELNVLRRTIETEVLEDAVLQAQEAVEKGLPFILVKGAHWHQGVVGIVAGRLKEKYNLPSFVLSIEGNEAKGSSRSIPGIDLGALVIEALNKGILTRGGGHPMAAGFSLDKSKIKDFEDFLLSFIEPKMAHLEDTSSVLEVDGVLDIMAVQTDLLDKLNQLEPYGEGNPEPRFVIHDVKVAKTILTNNGHIICKLAGRNGGSLDAVSFRSKDTEMGQKLLSHAPRQLFHFAGNLRLDTWNGKNKVQLFIQDACLAG